MAIDWAPTTELQYRRKACLGSAWTHILSLVSATTDTYVVLWEADIATRFVVINSPGPNHKSFLHAVTPEGQKKDISNDSKYGKRAQCGIVLLHIQ